MRLAISRFAVGFLVSTAGATDGALAVAARVEVVPNWFDELKQRVPVK